MYGQRLARWAENREDLEMAGKKTLKMDFFTKLAAEPVAEEATPKTKRKRTTAAKAADKKTATKAKRTTTARKKTTAAKAADKKTATKAKRATTARKKPLKNAVEQILETHNEPIAAGPVESTSPAETCTDPVARKYDVRNISSRELVQMSHELYQAGRIDQELLAMLSFQPELSTAYNQVGAKGIKRPDPNQHRDAIKEWHQILQTQTQFNNSSFFTSKTDDVIHLLETIDKARVGPALVV